MSAFSRAHMTPPLTGIAFPSKEKDKWSDKWSKGT